MNYNVRPGLSRPSLWHPYRLVGIQSWEPTEAETKYREGRAQPRKQSTETETVCLGGPYHGERIRSRWHRGRGAARVLVAELPDSFTCTPWRGTYRWLKNRDVIVWCDESFSQRDHVRVLTDYETKQAERKTKREEKRSGG